jgi:hypothetical protein
MLSAYTKCQMPTATHVAWIYCENHSTVVRQVSNSMTLGVDRKAILALRRLDTSRADLMSMLNGTCRHATDWSQPTMPPWYTLATCVAARLVFCLLKPL